MEIILLLVPLNTRQYPVHDNAHKQQRLKNKTCRTCALMNDYLVD